MLAAVLGWLGTGGTFLAYALLWRGRLSSGSTSYAALNLVGGLLGGFAAAFYQAWPSAAANFAWAALGVHAIVQVRTKSAGIERWGGQGASEGRQCRCSPGFEELPPQPLAAAEAMPQTGHSGPWRKQQGRVRGASTAARASRRFPRGTVT